MFFDFKLYLLRTQTEAVNVAQQGADTNEAFNDRCRFGFRLHWKQLQFIFIQSGGLSQSSTVALWEESKCQNPGHKYYVIPVGLDANNKEMNEEKRQRKNKIDSSL